MIMIIQTLLISFSLLTLCIAQTTVLYNNPSLVYSGGNNQWDPVNLFGGCSPGYRSNAHNGDSVSLTFTGTSVKVNFLRDHQGAAAQMFVDGNLITSISTFNANEVAFDNCGTVSGDSGPLSNGQHTVKVINNRDPGDTQLEAIYFIGFTYVHSLGLPIPLPTPPVSVVAPSSTPTSTHSSQPSQPSSSAQSSDSQSSQQNPSSTPIPSSGPSSTASSSFSLALVTPSITKSSNSTISTALPVSSNGVSALSSTTKSSNTAAIVGGVLGAVILLLALLFWWFYSTRRKKLRRLARCLTLSAAAPHSQNLDAVGSDTRAEKDTLRQSAMMSQLNPGRSSFQPAPKFASNCDPRYLVDSESTLPPTFHTTPGPTSSNPQSPEPALSSAVVRPPESIYSDGESLIRTGPPAYQR